MNRVRASLDDELSSPRMFTVPRRRPKHVAKVVAVPIVLAGAWALAFQVGHQLQEPESSPTIVERPMLPRGLPTQSWLLLPPVALDEGAEGVPVAEERSSITGSRAPSEKDSAQVDAYALELPVLQPAQRAVARRDFASALGPIAEHRRLFPSGVLAEEREALRVRALHGLGRVDGARRAAASFRKRFPHSALHDRMDGVLRSPD